MGSNQYSSYRGRKSWLRRILIAIVALLLIALIAVVVLAFLFPVEYASDGPRLVIPLFGGRATPTPTSTPTAGPSLGWGENTDDIIIDEPSLSPSPTPSPVPTPIPEMLPRRNTPLGLVSYEFPRLTDGSAKESLASGRGVIFDVNGADLTDPDIRDAILDLPYAVAMVAWDGDAQILTTLAGLGFDEILLTGTDDALTDAPRTALDDLGYLGRLSVVAEKAPFQNDTALGRLYAGQFDRVYVPGGNWGGLNLYQYLKDNGFRGSTADIVTTVNKPISANYSWAILPQ